MRRKILTALSLFFVLTLLFSAPLVHANQNNVFDHEEHHEDHGKPVTQPITMPVTGPVTGPVTRPAEFFTISGNVMYRFWGLFKHGMKRIVPQAAGVTIKVREIWGQKTVTTTTDQNGDYAVRVDKKGWYQVSPEGGLATFYLPSIEIVNVNKPGMKKHVNFEGILFRF